MTSVFVVFGSTGEYSALQEWPVRAYATEAEARACEERCEAYVKTCPDNGDYFARTRNNKEWSAWLAGNPDDPSMCYDYTGTSYSVAEVPFG